MDLYRNLIFVLGVIGLIALLESCGGNEICAINCFNDGVCIDNTCMCKEGFSGDSCQFENKCITDGISCTNGGTCVDGACDCPPGFIGNRCQFRNTPVTDASENSYPVVAVEDQLWMAANLRTIRCQGDTLIPEVTSNSEWQNLTTAGLSRYDNIEILTDSESYGLLYNWYAVNSCNICPQGWHVPTHSEWDKLVSNLGGANSAGNNMKAKDFWLEPDDIVQITDSVGWTAIPAGFRHEDGSFYNIHEYGGWWSATRKADEELAWYRSINYLSSIVIEGNTDFRYGYSVRCIKD